MTSRDKVRALLRQLRVEQPHVYAAVAILVREIAQSTKIGLRT
jgi:hypothetical protein